MENGGGSMINILLTSHGGMAQGMMQSVRMLVGEQQNLDYVTFEEEMGADELNEAFEKKIRDVSSERQYLIFCDIKGGTPFNVVSRYSYQNDNVAVIYGMNLPLLIEAIIQCGNPELTLENLAAGLAQQGKETIGLSEL